MDGLGLTVAEALSSGLPTIVSDNPPMNEFMNNKNGKKVKIDRLYSSKNGFYWPICQVNINDLSKCMQFYIDNKSNIKELKKHAREYAEKKLNWGKNATVIYEIFEKSHRNKEENIDKRELIDKVFKYEDQKNSNTSFYYKKPNSYKKYLLLKIFLTF